MNRNLAIGYLLTAVVIATALAILRGVVPSLDGIRALLVAQVALLGLIPTSLLTFNGARQSTGRVRKVVGFSVAAIDALIALGACMAIALIIVGNARVSAA